MRYSSPIVLAPLQGEWAVRAEDVCGGVWVEESGKFVPVQAAEPISIDENGTTLVEYANEEGRVWANLLSVPAGQASPTWQLTKKAAEAGYSEKHVAAAGAGTLINLVSNGVGQAVAYRNPLPEHQYPVGVYPVEAFRIEASKTLGIHVLATFSSAPFRDEYEQRVTLNEVPFQA